MIVDYNIKNSFPLFFAIAIFLYYLIVFFKIGFNLFMFTFFFVCIVLNLGLFYVLTHRLNKKQLPVKFYRVFIKVAYCSFLLFFLFGFLFNIFSKKHIMSDDFEYNYIIVFGSGVSLNENKNFIINKRIDKAIEYANKYPKTKFILTGAKLKDDAYEEALYMKNYMVDREVDSDRVLTDTLSVNTFENISNALYIIKSDIIKENQYENVLDSPLEENFNGYNINQFKIGLLSTDFHLCRINLMSKKVGISNIYNISVKSELMLKPYYYVQETLSLFKAFVLSQLSFV